MAKAYLPRSWVTTVEHFVIAPGIFECDCKMRLPIWLYWLVSWDHLTLRYIPRRFPDGTLVQVMAWSHQATCHYLSQCRPSFMTPSAVTRPKSVKAVKFVRSRLIISRCKKYMFPLFLRLHGLVVSILKHIFWYICFVYIHIIIR